MIYAASLFAPQHHHGRRVAVCRTLPKGAVVDRHLEFFAPPAALLWDWNRWKKEDAGITDDRIQQYKQRYWMHLVSIWDRLSEYMNALPADEVETWLCWEPQGEFCHRNLLLKLIERDWPQHLGRGGGADVPIAIAAPGIAWACEHLGLKVIDMPIVPPKPKQSEPHDQHVDRARSQLLFFPDVANS